MARDGDALEIEVRGKIRDFQRAMAQAESRVNKLEKSVDRDMRRIQQSSRQAAQGVERSFGQASRNVIAQAGRMRTGIAGALGGLGMGAGAGFLGAAGAGGLVASINQAASSVAQLRAEADRAGVAFEEFQRLDFVSQQQKVSIDALTDGLKELNLRADEFIVTGVGPAAEAFNRLGFSAEDLARRLEDPIELMMEIMRRAQDLDTAGQLRVFDELFGGTGGEQFVQLMRAGPEALRRGMQDAAIYTDDVADKAAEVDRRFQAVANIIETRVNTNLVEAAATALDVAEAIGRWRTAVEGFLSAMSDAVGNAGVFERLNRNLDPDDLPEGMRLLADNLKSGADEATALDARVAETVEEGRRLASEIDLVRDMLDAARASGDELSIQHYLAEWERLAGLLDQNIERTRVLGGAIGSMAPPGIGPTGSVGTVSNARHYLGQRLVDGNEDIANLKQAAAAGAAAVLAMPEFGGVRVQSAYRSPEHNSAVGGATRSRHMEGDAVDFVGVPEAMLGQFVRALQAQGFRGFGYYGGGNLHADMGPARAWGPDRTSGSLGQTPRAFRDAVGMAPPAPVPARRGSQGAVSATSPAADAEARTAQAEAIRQVNAALTAQLELLGLEGEALAAATITRAELAEAQNAEALVREKVRDLREQGVEVTQQMEEAIRAEVAALYELQGAQDGAAASTDRLAERARNLEGAFQSVGQPILDTFMGIVSGSENASEALKRLAMQLANMVLQGALFGSGPLGRLFGGGLFGGLFGGFRASGGPVGAGTPYVVGERGPELFVPRSSGRVIDAASTRAMLSRASTPVRAAGAGGEPVRIELTSRFAADGGFSTAVERASRPVAVREARTAAGEVAVRVPEIADARADQREQRRTRPLRPSMGLGG